MKSLIQMIRVILILLLCFFVFTWLIVYHGSGHQIPLNTDLSFAYTIGILIVLIIVITIINRKYKINH